MVSANGKPTMKLPSHNSRVGCSKKSGSSQDLVMSIRLLNFRSFGRVKEEIKKNFQFHAPMNFPLSSLSANIESISIPSSERILVIDQPRGCLPDPTSLTLARFPAGRPCGRPTTIPGDIQVTRGYRYDWPRSFILLLPPLLLQPPSKANLITFLSPPNVNKSSFPCPVSSRGQIPPAGSLL
ncbi:hypothetical protein J6590_023687 [Homalodisca vitripennis]|nr:hypothetical protein J6590_023687 [Homalodisca vitripennis]